MRCLRTEEGDIYFKHHVEVVDAEDLCHQQQYVTTIKGVIITMDFL